MFAEPQWTRIAGKSIDAAATEFCERTALLKSLVELFTARDAFIMPDRRSPDCSQPQLASAQLRHSIPEGTFFPKLDQIAHADPCPRSANQRNLTHPPDKAELESDWSSECLYFCFLSSKTSHITRWQRRRPGDKYATDPVTADRRSTSSSSPFHIHSRRLIHHNQSNKKSTAVTVARVTK